MFFTVFFIVFAVISSMILFSMNFARLQAKNAESITAKAMQQG
ncbi:hypothetical protein QUB68_22170 [Microcoleus sp. A006_D1]